MAIFIQGAGQPCPLCGKSLDEGLIDLFPPFLTNQKDPLYLFSDAAVHSGCLGSNPMARLAAEMAADFKERIKPANRVCNIAGTRITNPEDWVFIDGLSSDPAEAVFRLNFLSFDRNNLTGSEMWQEIKRELSSFALSGRWENRIDPMYINRLTKS